MVVIGCSYLPDSINYVNGMGYIMFMPIISLTQDWYLYDKNKNMLEYYTQYFCTDHAVFRQWKIIKDKNCTGVGGNY